MVYGRYMRDIYIILTMVYKPTYNWGAPPCANIRTTWTRIWTDRARHLCRCSQQFSLLSRVCFRIKRLIFFGSESDIAILSMEWTPSSLSFTMFPKRFQEVNSTPIRHNCWPSEDKPSHESGKRRVPGFWGQDILPIVPKGSPTWCACNSKAELISSKEGCEATGGGRDQECEWFTWRVASAQPSPSSWNRDFFHSFQLRFC